VILGHVFVDLLRTKLPRITIPTRMGEGGAGLPLSLEDLSLTHIWDPTRKNGALAKLFYLHSHTNM
jgi:hypothetical protein